MWAIVHDSFTGNYIVDADRWKLRTIVGDGAKNGITTLLNGGVRIGADRTTFPTESLLENDFRVIDPRVRSVDAT